MTEVEGGVADVVAAARRLEPLIRDRAEEIEQEGRLPPELVDEMAAAGLFQLYLPASAGGPEVDPLTALRVCEQLARADGSVGWCVSVSSALSNYLGWLPPDGLAEIAGPVPRLRLSGSARPLGTAVPAEGGFVARGRWDFASNVLQSDWYAGTCVIEEGPRADGRPPRTRAMLFPVGDGRVEQTWSVLGMRGTGSHDFAVDDVFVPARRVTSLRHALAQPGRIFHPRLGRVVIWAPTAGVALGLARGALDDFAALSEVATSASPVPLCQRADVQLAVGQAEAITSAARAYCVDALAEAWDMVGREGADSDAPGVDRTIAHARLAITHAMGEAVRVVDLLQRAAGTSGVFTRAGLERRFRDAHVAAQHAAGLALHIEAAGRVLLGLPADVPFF